MARRCRWTNCFFHGRQVGTRGGEPAEVGGCQGRYIRLAIGILLVASIVESLICTSISRNSYTIEGRVKKEEVKSTYFWYYETKEEYAPD